MSEAEVVDAQVVEDGGGSEVAPLPVPHTDLAPAPAPAGGGEVVTLWNTRNPSEIVKAATDVATALADVIEKQGLSRNLGGRKKHVEIDGWQVCGTLLGAQAMTTGTQRVEPHREFPVKTHRKKYGYVNGKREVVEEFTDEWTCVGWSYDAVAEVRTIDGRVIGRGEATCSREEENWLRSTDSAVKGMAQCVPLRTRILTKRGFCTHEEVRVGEPVLAYDLETDQCRWTPLRAINRFGPEPVVRMQNRSFDFTCTSDHSWAVRGQTGVRSLVKAMELGTRRIVVAAPAPGGDHPATPDVAEILGWVITDGTIQYSRSGGVRVHIDQSKPEHVATLRRLLDGLATESINRPAGEHTFPSGVTYATRQAHRFNLNAKFGRALLAMAGINGKDEVVTEVTEFSVEARRAMLRAMLAADGARKPSEGGFEGGRYRFSKQNGSVMETFRLLCALEGLALGRLTGFENVNGSWQPAQTLRANRFTMAQSLRIEAAGSEPVWCPTTDYGTWVAELDGNVSITGNTRACSRALRQALGFIVGLAGYSATPQEEMEAAGIGPALEPATEEQKAQLRAALAYLVKPSGEQVWGEIKGAFDGELYGPAVEAVCAVIRARREIDESEQGESQAEAA